jgi:hypothetical protein
MRRSAGFIQGKTVSSMCAAMTLLIAVPGFASIHVQPSQLSFNPTSHQTVTYDVTLDRAGTLTAQVLDRDTFVVKALASNQAVKPGSMTLTWDGTDEQGRIVPDEAWSLRLVLKTSSGIETISRPALRPRWQRSSPISTIPVAAYCATRCPSRRACISMPGSAIDPQRTPERVL